MLRAVERKEDNPEARAGQCWDQRDDFRANTDYHSRRGHQVSQRITREDLQFIMSK